MNKKIKKLIFCFSIITMAIILIVAVFYNGLTIEKYTLETDKLSKSIRIVFIADLHSCIYGKNQSVLLDKIAKQNPDIVMLGGDITDEFMPNDGAIMLLEGMKNKYRCYYVTGNHEYLAGNVDKIKQMIRAYGISVLEGEKKEITIKGQKINICGLDDPYVGNEEFSRQLKSFSDMDTKNYTILLTHRPELIDEYTKYNFNLILSGHTHGGQWRIPFILNGVYAPEQGWFPKYAGGLYKHGNLIHIVSRGLAKQKKTPRIFNPPELVVVDIKPK